MIFCLAASFWVVSIAFEVMVITLILGMLGLVPTALAVTILSFSFVLALLIAFPLIVLNLFGRR